MPRLVNPIYIQDYSFVMPHAGELASTAFTKNANGIHLGALSHQEEQQLSAFLSKHGIDKKLDRSVQLALLAASGLAEVPENTGINVGSSRGATGLWEREYAHFRESGTASTLTSPLTTLGNISSWVGQHLKLSGPQLSHSITCATAGHAFLNSIAWINSGMAETMIAGGSEAPLTDFTIAQMQALRIYSREQTEFPSRALDLTKKSNQMILGEGAAVFTLSSKRENSKYKITGYGTAIEQLSSATSVSKFGQNLVDSMKSAIEGISIDDVDAIVTHAPGTIKGDQAEMAAIKTVFGNRYPRLLNNKWQIGHTLGASSAMNVVTAIQTIDGKQIDIPFLDTESTNPRADSRKPKRVLINATGFGGNGVSLIIESAI
jgi:3-oxoacyl-(acyl-carrier-protein) synthase